MFEVSTWQAGVECPNLYVMSNVISMIKRVEGPLAHLSAEKGETQALHHRHVIEVMMRDMSEEQLEVLWRLARSVMTLSVTQT